MANVTWNTLLSGDWNTGADWNGGSPLPGPNDAVFINGNGSAPVVTHSAGNHTITSLDVEQAGFHISGGTLTVRGSTTFNGGFVATAGLLSLGGSGANTTGVFNQVGGTIVVRSGALDLGNANDSLAGTINGGGALVINFGTTTVKSTASLGIARFTDAGGTLALGGNIAYGGAFELDAGAAVVLHGHTLTLSGKASLGGGLIAGVGEVDVTGSAALDATTLDGAAILQIDGDATEVSNLDLGATAGSTALLRIGAGHTLTMLNGSQIIGISTQSRVVNAGQLIVADGLLNGFISESFSSTGTLSVQSGGLGLTTATLAGVLSGAGTLFLNQQATLAAGLKIGIALLETNVGTIILAANQSDAQSVALGQAGTLNLNHHTFDITGSLYMGIGAGTGALLTGGGTVATSGAVYINGASIDANTVLSVAGVADQTSDFSITAASGGAASLRILAGGTYKLDGSHELTSVGPAAAVLSNAGTLLRTGSSGLAEINLAVINTGTVEGQRGDLQFLQPVSGAGTVKIDGGALVDFEASSAAATTVAFSGFGGELRLGNGAPDFASTITGFLAGDEIGLSEFDPTQAHITGFSGGVLRVTDGTNTANLHFAGAGLTAASFTIGYGEIGAAVFHV